MYLAQSEPILSHPFHVTLVYYLRISQPIALLVFKRICGLSPAQLSDLITAHSPTSMFPISWIPGPALQ